MKIIVFIVILVISVSLGVLFVFLRFRSNVDLSEQLSFACHRSDPGAVDDIQKFLNEGADPNYEFIDGRPLDVAAETGNYPVVELLLKYGADKKLVKNSTIRLIDKMKGEKANSPLSQPLNEGIK